MRTVTASTMLSLSVMALVSATGPCLRGSGLTLAFDGSPHTALSSSGPRQPAAAAAAAAAAVGAAPGIAALPSPPLPAGVDFVDSGGCVLAFENMLQEPVDLELVPMPGTTPPDPPVALPYGATLKWSLTRAANGTVLRGPLPPGDRLAPVFAPGPRVAYFPAWNASALRVTGTYTGGSATIVFGGRDHALSGNDSAVCIVLISKPAAAAGEKNNAAATHNLGNAFAQATLAPASLKQVLALGSYPIVVLGGADALPRFQVSSNFVQTPMTEHMQTVATMSGKPQSSLIFQPQSSIEPSPHIPACGDAESPRVLLREPDALIPSSATPLPVQLSLGRQHSDLSLVSSTTSDAPATLGPCRSVPINGVFPVPPNQEGKISYSCLAQRVDGSGQVASLGVLPISDTLLLCTFACDAVLLGKGDTRIMGVMRQLAPSSSESLIFVGEEAFGRFGVPEILFSWENTPGGSNPHDRGDLSVNPNVRLDGGAAAGAGCLIKGADGKTTATSAALGLNPASFVPGALSNKFSYGISANRSYVFASNVGPDSFDTQCLVRRPIQAVAFAPRFTGDPDTGWGRQMPGTNVTLQWGQKTPWFLPTSAADGGVGRLLITASGPTDGEPANSAPIQRDLAYAVASACVNFQGRFAMFCSVLTTCVGSSPRTPSPSGALITAVMPGKVFETELPNVACEARSSAGETMKGVSRTPGVCDRLADDEDLGGWVPQVGPGIALWQIHALTLGGVAGPHGLESVTMQKCTAKAAHGVSTELPTFRIVPFAIGVGAPYIAPTTNSSSSSSRSSSSSSSSSPDADSTTVWSRELPATRTAQAGSGIINDRPSSTGGDVVHPSVNFTAGSDLTVVGYFNVSRPLVVMMVGFSCQMVVINVTVTSIRTAVVHIPADYDCSADRDNSSPGWVTVKVVDAELETLLPVPIQFQDKYAQAYYTPRARASPSVSPNASPSVSPNASPSASASAQPSPGTSPSPYPRASVSTVPGADAADGSGKSGKSTKIAIIAGASAGSVLVLGGIIALLMRARGGGSAARMSEESYLPMDSG
jgi:hypothetical protein